jgi:choline dehydrogenase-like flavoprotein
LRKEDRVMQTSKRFDAIIVGSGPGGATLAKELASASQRVLLVECGSPMKGTGLLASRDGFIENGRLIRSDGGIWIGRARVVGGSSHFAMGNAVTPPARILREWRIDLATELASARADLHVQPMPARLIGEGTKRINAGARSLGWEMRLTPKCVDFTRCKACGLCMFGCTTGAKWTASDFVDQAVANGAELLTGTEVKRVMQRDGQAVGVAALRGSSLVYLHSDRIILCAGALGTPRILQNSGVSQAGKGLALDVFQTTYGYTQDVGMQREIILATYLEAIIDDRELFAAPYMYIPYLLVRDIEGNAPVRQNLLVQARTMLKSQKVRANHLIGMMTKIRDERTGEVQNDGTVLKSLTQRDLGKLEEAHEINRAILVAAGADPDSIFRGVYEAGHPCCTAAIGEVIDEHQETEIEGLFVSDASAFPSPLGMPPILTIVALSKRLAKYLLS